MMRWAGPRVRGGELAVDCVALVGGGGKEG